MLALQDGRVLDRASDQLSKVRGQRRDNMQSLRQSMNEWARKLAAQKVSEEALVVIRRDRLCVPVKAGRQVGIRKKRKEMKRKDKKRKEKKRKDKKRKEKIRKEKKRKDYAFRRRLNEKPSIIPGCPGSRHHRQA